MFGILSSTIRVATLTHSRTKADHVALKAPRDAHAERSESLTEARKPVAAQG
ncbi:hypothetical protein [Pararhodobacter oceanensis]|uniref:hypothetical protein n=1 Tax=Pararhodobacter oceanensis TaxID=2172121 RepID=UPI003A954F33